MNGKIGEAKDFNVSNCRYNVEIFGSGEVIACKRDNLREVKHTAANTKVRCPVNLLQPFVYIPCLHHPHIPSSSDLQAAKKPAPPLASKWHLFLSHTQRNGEAKALAAELFYEFKAKGYESWLDVKMPNQDKDAMKEGVLNSSCIIAVITGDDVKEHRYFERECCVDELKWAIEAGKNIIPVVIAADKPKVGEYIKEGISKGIDLSACDFKHVDRSNQDHLDASLKTIMSAMDQPPKARVVTIVSEDEPRRSLVRWGAPRPSPSPASTQSAFVATSSQIAIPCATAGDGGGQGGFRQCNGGCDTGGRNGGRGGGLGRAAGRLRSPGAARGGDGVVR